MSGNQLRPPIGHQRNMSTGAGKKSALAGQISTEFNLSFSILDVSMRQVGGGTGAAHQRKVSGSNISRKSAPPGGWNEDDSVS